MKWRLKKRERSKEKECGAVHQKLAQYCTSTLATFF